MRWIKKLISRRERAMLIHDPRICKLGKLPPKRDPRDLKLSKYIALPPAPPYLNWGENIAPAGWGMMGNDQYGDCVAEGTIVDSRSVNAAYRAPYKGPLIEFVLASGKTLSVTPNHAVLTPRGFIRAKVLQKGDNLVGTSGAQILPRTNSCGGKLNIDDLPSKIEQVFAAHAVGNNLVREIMPVSVDFHGDEVFCGDVDVVSANSFLWGKAHPSLREPHTQNQISSASKLKRGLHRARSALQGSLGRLRSAFGDICLSCDGSPFGYAHAGVTQTNSLKHGPKWMPGGGHSLRQAPTIDSKLLGHTFHSFPRRILPDGFGEVSSPTGVKHTHGDSAGPELKASRAHPAVNGVPTDPGLPGNLFKAFPGLIALDRIVDINVKTLSHGFVYDLSTDDHWYLANGLVTHNCTCAAVGHAVVEDTSDTGATVQPTTADVLGLYTTVTGEEGAAFDPATGANDNGCVITDVLNEWRNNGFLGHKLGAYAGLDPRNRAHMKAAIDLFGTVDIGIGLPITAQNQSTWFVTQASPLTGDAAPYSWGGHSIILLGYNKNVAYGVTWGQIKYMTWPWLAAYCDEAWALLSNDWVSGTAPAPSGFNLAQLQKDLQAL